MHASLHATSGELVSAGLCILLGILFGLQLLHPISMHAFVCVQIGAGTSEVRRFLIGRQLFQECVEGKLDV